MGSNLYVYMAQSNVLYIMSGNDYWVPITEVFNKYKEEHKGEGKYQKDNKGSYRKSSCVVNFKTRRTIKYSTSWIR